MTTLAEARALGTPLIERTVRKSVPCRACKCPLDRSIVLRRVQDLSACPSDSIEDICADLRAQGEAWRPKNDICTACAESAPDQNARAAE